MSAFEFQPVDKTVRSPKEMQRRLRNKIEADLARQKITVVERRDVEIEA